MTYCIKCGTQHQSVKFPKKCDHCSHEMYINPIPVAVVLVKTNKGVMLVKRAIPPQIGHWALPGGFINEGETAQEAGRRELKEETGLDYQGPLLLMEVASSSNRKQMMVFFTTEIIDVSNYLFQANEEASEVKFVSQIETLAFETHTQILTRLLMQSQK